MAMGLKQRKRIGNGGLGMEDEGRIRRFEFGVFDFVWVMGIWGVDKMIFGWPIRISVFDMHSSPTPFYFILNLFPTLFFFFSINV